MMSATRTPTVTVPAEIADALDQSVQRGEFASESEAFSDAVQSWEKHRNEKAQTLENIRRRIKRSMADPRPGIPIEEVEAYMKQYMIEHKQYVDALFCCGRRRGTIFKAFSSEF